MSLEGIGDISTSKDGKLERGDLNRQGLKKGFSEKQMRCPALFFIYVVSTTGRTQRPQGFQIAGVRSCIS